jgi:hypothetical protein
MSYDIEPGCRYRQCAARLRSLVADSGRPAVVEILLGIALNHEQLAKLREDSVANLNSRGARIQSA